MKLIDVLAMISKGELKEGTKIKLLYDDTIYELYCDDLIREGDNMPIFGLYSFEVLREEVELIEPEGFDDIGDERKHWRFRYELCKIKEFRIEPMKEEEDYE